MKVNFEQIVGKIKPMHAVGQPPFMGMNFETCRYLQEAHIPYSRLHDVGGALGGGRFVDIPNLFPDFDADENDPASYAFDYTDYLIEQILQYDVAPYFRLGVTIENAVRQGIKPRRIMPPKDFGKWARICEHVIRHYNEGWADGFHYGIKYWEIWNEPENGYPGAPAEKLNQCWTGTAEELYELYTVTAKHLKACFGDSIKVGGYGACSNYGLFPAEEVPAHKRGPVAEYRNEFFHGFLSYVREHDAPLDFFSWHSYWDVPHAFLLARKNRECLNQYGFEKTESHFNEWNPDYKPEDRDTDYAAANAAAMMLGMQNEDVDLLCYYDARIGPSVYAGMFNPLTREPFALYYGFKAFGELYLLGDQAECTVEEEKVYAVAATDGKTQAVLISNIGEDVTLTTNLEGFEVYLVDEEHHLERVDWNSKEFLLKANQVVYLTK